jgi:hypothetical protein
VKEAEQVEVLLAQAASTPLHEFAELARGVVSNNTYCADDGRLADIDRKLSLVRVITPVGRTHLFRIRETVDRLLATGQEAAGTPESEVPDRPTPGEASLRSGEHHTRAKSR